MTLKKILTSSLPDFKALSLREGVRLTLIVGSSISIALAGQMAQSRSQETTERTVESSRLPIENSKLAQSKFEKFARAQVVTFQELLDALTERAELVSLMRSGDSEDKLSLQITLKKFDENLMIVRDALARAQESATDDDQFFEEDLRASLFAVQESASHAQGQMIGLDELQGFRVSRTGQ